MSNSPKRALLSALKTIKENGPRNRLTGACHNIDLELMEMKTSDKTAIAVFGLRRDLFAAWPSFSGDIGYPVADPNVLESANLQYTAAFYAKKMWDKRCRYARLRYELIDWMIKELEGDISDGQN